MRIVKEAFFYGTLISACVLILVLGAIADIPEYLRSKAGRVSKGQS